MNTGERCPKTTQGRCKQFLLCSINYPDMFPLPNAIFRGLHLWKDSVTPWRWHLEVETCRGNLLSTIKTAYNALEHLLDIFHLIKNARYNGQDYKYRINIERLHFVK
jgi:hypothetical protein